MGLRSRRAVGALPVLLLVAACGPSIPSGASPGARLYAVNCQGCHGSNGEGVRGMQPPLAGTPVPAGDARVMLGWVMYGERPAALPRGVYAGVMPQFSFLTDADLAAVLTHVRTNFGNHAPPVTVDEVAAVRRAHPGG